MSYDERKAPVVNIEDAKKIMEMVWHQETNSVKLSDGRTVVLVDYEGPNASAFPSVTESISSLIHPEPLEDLVFALLENDDESFIVNADEKCKICGFQRFESIEHEGCGSHH